MNFDLANTSLPHGVTVLEASAGTGKTYALAGIYLRLVIEHDLTPGQILVTTYTEAATAELRGRIRERLENADSVFRGAPPDDNDTLLPALLARVEKTKAIERLTNALRGFDEAAIHTIHGFCERTLKQNAFESGSTFDAELLPDQSDLLREVAADFYRSQAYGSDPLPAALALACDIGVETLSKLLPRVLSNPQIKILPDNADIAAKQNSARKLNTTFVSKWGQWRDEVRALFLTPEGNIWAKAGAKHGVTEPLLDALDKLAVSNEAPVAAYRAFAQFTNEWLAEQTLKKPKRETPRHDFFDLSSQFAELLAGYGPAANAEFLAWARIESAKRKASRGLRSFDDLLTTLHAALHSAKGDALAASIRAQYHAALVDEFQDTDSVQDSIFSRVFGGDGTWLFLIGDPKQAIYGFRGADVFSYLAATQRPGARRFTLGTNYRSTRNLVSAVNALFAPHERPFIEERIRFQDATAAGRAEEKSLLVDGTARAPMQLWHWENDKPINTGTANAQLPDIVAAEIRRMLDTATLGGALLRPCDCAVLTFTNDQARAVQAALAALNVPAVVMSNASIFESREAVQLRILLAALADPSREDKVRAARMTDFFTTTDDDALFSEAHARWMEKSFIVMFREFLRVARVRETLLSRPGGERALTNVLQLSELIQKATNSQRLGPAGVVRWLGQHIAAKSAGDEHELRLERDDEAVHVVTVHKSKGLEYPVVFCPFAWTKADRRGDEAAIFHDDSGAITLDLTASKGCEAYQRMLNEKLAEHVRLLYVALTRAEHECHVVVGKFNQCAISALLWLLDPPNTAGDVAAALKSAEHTDFAARLCKLVEQSPECFALRSLPDTGAKPWQPSMHGNSAPLARKFSGSIERTWGVMSFTGIVEGAENEAADHDNTPTPEPGLELSGIHSLPRGMRFGNCIHEIFEHLDFTNDASIEPLVLQQLRKHGMQSMERATAVADCVRRVLAHPASSLASCPTARTLRELEFHLPAKLLTPDQLTEFAGAGLAFEPRQGILKGFMDLVFERNGRFHILDWKSNWLGADGDAYTPEAMKAEMRRHRYGLQWRLYLVALHRFLRTRLHDYDPALHLGEIYYVFLRGIDPDRPELGVVREAPELAQLTRLDALFTTP